MSEQPTSNQGAVIDGLEHLLKRESDAQVRILPDGTVEPIPPAKEWRCFHCDEVLRTPRDARLHFGNHGSEPACLIKAPGEFALLTVLRNAEDELARHRAEDSDVLRAMWSMQADHAEALRREEEKGYSRGLADAKEHPETLGLQRASESKERYDDKRASDCCRNSEAKDVEIERLKKQLSERLQQLEELKAANHSPDAGKMPNQESALTGRDASPGTVADGPAGLAQPPGGSPPFEFDRYRRGRLMAEGISVTKATTLEQAMQKAATMAGAGDVLVLRQPAIKPCWCPYCGEPHSVDHVQRADATKAEPPNESQWIVGRPPKDDGTYLIENRKGQVAPYIRGIIHNNAGSPHDWEFGEAITGWMPLPRASETKPEAPSKSQQRRIAVQSDGWDASGSPICTSITDPDYRSSPNAPEILDQMLGPAGETGESR